VQNSIETSSSDIAKIESTSTAKAESFKYNFHILCDYIIENYKSLDTQTLITLCEQHMHQSINDIKAIHFCENYDLVLSQNDIGKAVLHSDDNKSQHLYIYLNNLGLLGMQSGAPSYMINEILGYTASNTQSNTPSNKQSNAAVDFINIFNNILARLIYVMKSSLQLNYMNAQSIQSMCANSITDLSYVYNRVECRLYAHKIISKYTLIEVLSKYCQHQARVIINKLHFARFVIDESLQMHIGNCIGSKVLGRAAYMPHQTHIEIIVYARDVYDALLAADAPIHAIINKLIPSMRYYLKVVPDHTIYVPAIIGRMRLGHGVCI
jgi:hypothetical protein